MITAHKVVLHLLAAAAVRFVLAWLGTGALLKERHEFATPTTELLRTREALFNLRLGRSPYERRVYHGAPLMLLLQQATAEHETLYVLPGIAADCVAAILLAAIATCTPRTASKGDDGLQQHQQRPCNDGVSPTALAALYLWNPLTLLPCIAGSSGGWENVAVFLALWGTLRRNPPAAASGLACAAYLGMHPVMHLVPLTLLFALKPEDLLQDPSSSPELGTSELMSTKLKASNTPPAATPLAPPAAKSRRGSAFSAMAFLAFTVLWACGLWALSDAALREYSPHGCYGGQASGGEGCRGTVEGLPEALRPRHWAEETYGFMYRVENFAPNIGMLWYFYAQMFRPQLPFFRFQFAFTFAALVAVAAARLPHRPLFLFLYTAVLATLLRPYPSTYDIAQYLALLPLFAAQLRVMKSKLMLAVSFLTLAGLEPAIFWLWMHRDALNANFFYAITQVIAAWQVMILLQLVGASLQCDALPYPRQLQQQTATALEERGVRAPDH